jgi:hypothetical protein
MGRDVRARGGALGPPETATSSADESLVIRRRSVLMQDTATGLQVDASALVAVGQGALRMTFTGQPKARDPSDHSRDLGRFGIFLPIVRWMTNTRAHGKKNDKETAGEDGSTSCSIELTRDKSRDMLLLARKSKRGISGRLRFKGDGHVVMSTSLPSKRSSAEMDVKLAGTRALTLTSRFGSLRVVSSVLDPAEASASLRRSTSCATTLRCALPFQWSGGSERRGTVETTLVSDGAHTCSVSPGGSCPLSFSATMVARRDAEARSSSVSCFPLLRLRARGQRDGNLRAELAYAGGLRARAEGTIVLPNAIETVGRSMRRAAGSLGASAESDADADGSNASDAAANAGHGIQFTAALGSVEGTSAGVSASASISTTTALGVATAHAAIGGPAGLVVEAPLGSGYLSLDVLAAPGTRMPAIKLCAGFYN